MTLGAEPKKVAILVVLVVVALGGLYVNSTGESSQTSAPRVVSKTAPVTAPATNQSVSPARTPARTAATEFRPRVPGSRPDDKIDPTKIDPELKLYLLAKVQAVPPMEAGRNLFQFGAAPVEKPLPAVPTIPKIVVSTPAPPPQTNVLSSVPTGPPPAPPINLKYYGYKISMADGRKEAYLLDGEDIIRATENQTVKNRYRIVNIGKTSIQIEDTQAKSTQTLKIQDNPT